MDENCPVGSITGGEALTQYAGTKGDAFLVETVEIRFLGPTHTFTLCLKDLVTERPTVGVRMVRDLNAMLRDSWI